MTSHWTQSPIYQVQADNGITPPSGNTWPDHCAGCAETLREGGPISTIRPAPRRVVHVIYSGLGGHSAVMFSLLEAGFMADAHHRVILAGIEEPPRDYLVRLGELGVDWMHVGKREGRAHLAFYRQLKQSMFAGGSDVVFLHGVAAIPSVAMTLGRRSRGTVVILRETEATQVKTSRVWAMLALAHRCTDAIVHLTPEAAQDAERKLRTLNRPGKVHIIGNGLDVDFFSPGTRGKSGLVAEPKLRIGMVARLQPNKDHLTLIEAFDRLCRKRPDIDARLEIAGGGITRPALEDMISQRGLMSRVTLHGTLGTEEVRDLLRRLDIYVHATFGETMSNSIMQAMAVGLPVIASSVPGVTNMITPGLGRLYPSQNPDTLCSMLCDWLENREEARRHGTAARAHAVEHYGARKTAQAYEALVTRLAQGRIS